MAEVVFPVGGAGEVSFQIGLRGSGGGGVTSLPWSSITDKPDTFPPDAHQHQIGDVEGLAAALEGKQPATEFRTINGEAITGTGDIVIPKGDKGNAAQIIGFAASDTAGYNAAVAAHAGNAQVLVVRYAQP